jgi:hypothetical protein
VRRHNCGHAKLQGYFNTNTIGRVKSTGSDGIMLYDNKTVGHSIDLRSSLETRPLRVLRSMTDGILSILSCPVTARAD